MNKNIIPSYFGALKIFMDSEKGKGSMLILKCLLFAVLIYFPLFGHLDTLPIRLWDESRLAINAYEMYKDGDLIVTHFEGKPDMWNTKPPLLIWCQAGLMHVLGVNELAIRLPSAIAAFLTCMLLFLIAIFYINNKSFAFIAVLVLVSSEGYTSLHCTRTGDYDALLIFFSMLYCFSYFAYLHTQQSKYLYLFFIAASLAVLTKSITGVLFLPGLFIYTVYRRQVWQTLKNFNFYVGILIYLLTVGGYYFLREAENPGYIAQVWKNELGGRFLEVTENHSQSQWYFVQSIFNQQYTYWSLFALSGLFIGLYYMNKKIFELTIFLFILTSSFFVIITISQTKLLWYDTPLFPLLALLSTIALYFLYTLLKNAASLQHVYRMKILPYLFLLCILFPPYWNIMMKTFIPKEADQYMAVPGFYEMSYYLKDIINGKEVPLDSYLVIDGYTPHINFYCNILSDRNCPMKRKNCGELLPNQVVVFNQQKVKDFIEKNFQYEVIKQKENIKTLKLLQRKAT